MPCESSCEMAESHKRRKKKDRDELGRAEARLGPPLSAIISARRWRIPVPQPRPAQIWQMDRLEFIIRLMIILRG